MSRWKALFRFSLTEALVGMLLMAGMFLAVNRRYTDEIINLDLHGRGDWMWHREAGFPFNMREMITLCPSKEMEKVDPSEIIYDHTRTYGPRVIATALSKLTPPDSFLMEEVSISGIVYNLLIDLAILFILHLGYVVFWRARREATPSNAPKY